jgi:hypothetical protein
VGSWHRDGEEKLPDAAIGRGGDRSRRERRSRGDGFFSFFAYFGVENGWTAGPFDRCQAPIFSGRHEILVSGFRFELLPEMLLYVITAYIILIDERHSDIWFHQTKI